MPALPANGEYLVRYHGQYSAARPKQFWWRETSENDCDLRATITDIEDHAECKLDCVLLVEFIDGKRIAKDVTQEIVEILEWRERQHREEDRDDAADRGDWEFEQRQQAAE